VAWEPVSMASLHIRAIDYKDASHPPQGTSVLFVSKPPVGSVKESRSNFSSRGCVPVCSHTYAPYCLQNQRAQTSSCTEGLAVAQQ
jgi:hypothetical protein